MSAAVLSEEDLDRVVCHSDSCDPGTLELTPVQGYLFSRIDGQTPWRLLREIGGLASADVDSCLQQWLAKGLIDVDAGASERVQRNKPEPAKPAAKVASAVEAPKPEIDESRIDSSLDIDEAVQRHILEFEAGLDRSYYEILGVGLEADVRDLKRAYFRLSKEFHPDRYFRRNIGDYTRSLDRIFKKVLEAHELLSDPTTRAEIDRSQGPLPEYEIPGKEQAASPKSKASSASARLAAKRPLTPIERLKQRMPYKISAKGVAERCAKAAEFYQSAQVAARGLRFLEAASSARLAIAFDPSKAEYKRCFAEIQVQAAEARVEQLLQRDDSSMDHDEQLDAMALYEETLLYRPHDPVINSRAALLALALHQIESAREYAERAVEHSPEEGAYHRVLARVFKAQGDRGHAVRELELALKFDRDDTEARELLRQLKRRSRRVLSERESK